MPETFLKRRLRRGFGGPYVVYVVCGAHAWLCNETARTQLEVILLVSNHAFSSWKISAHALLSRLGENFQSRQSTMSSRDLEVLLLAFLRANNVSVQRYLKGSPEVPPQSLRVPERAVLHSPKVEEVNFFGATNVRTTNTDFERAQMLQCYYKDTSLRRPTTERKVSGLPIENDGGYWDHIDW
jgi:hypothetical protein